MNPQDFPQPSRAARVKVVIKALNEEARIGPVVVGARTALGAVALADLEHHRDLVAAERVRVVVVVGRALELAEVPRVLVVVEDVVAVEVVH